MNNTEESFIKQGGITFDTRKANAVRAYWEWMPLRQVDLDDNLRSSSFNAIDVRIWRNFSMGSLLDLVILDTRLYDRDITDMNWNREYIAQIAEDENRSVYPRWPLFLMR